MPEPAEFWCGPDEPPGGKRRSVIRLDTTPLRGNVNLRIENISRKLVQTPPPLILDLLEVASYIYAADQRVSRGGEALQSHGADWRRELALNIPVRQLQIWDSEAVKKSLSDLLKFLSDDYFDFTFRPHKGITEIQGYFTFDDGPWFKADEVMLFSGGLDSFAGLVEALRARHGKIALVSHRSAPQTDHLQKQLLSGLKNTVPCEGRILHVPVWVNKAEKLTKGTTQRTRSFLYVSLAAALAYLVDVARIDFYENGITSSNLAVEPSMIGSRASRTTHPRVLRDFGGFFSLLFGRPMAVANPFFWKTKAEVVDVIREHGLHSLIRFTRSCSHVRTSEAVSNHCGVCSQCVGRRLAMVAGNLEVEDPEELYKIKHPLDSMPKEPDRAMVELILKAGRELNSIPDLEFFQQYPQAIEVATALDPSSNEAAKRLWELHRRHGHQVCAAAEKFVHENESVIARGTVPAHSLLSMIVGVRPAEQPTAVPRISLPAGTTWENLKIEVVSNDSVRIHTGGFTRVYHFIDLGFLDHRRHDLPNAQWNVLVGLAETNGTFSWSSPRAKAGAYKKVQLLRNHLKTLFGLTGNPIHGYKRGTGYVTRFQIVDCRR